MIQVVENVLRHDGQRYAKLISDHEINLASYLSPVHPMAIEKMQKKIQADLELGIHTMELTWPAYGPCDFGNNGPRKFRRFMVVNYVYAAKVSDCIRLAVDAFMVGTCHFPKLAYVRDLPKGAEDGMEVHGVILIESEIAPGNCVLVGGLA